jgi:hypothetical protein
MAVTSKIRTSKAARPLLKATTSKVLLRWATTTSNKDPFPPARALILLSKVPTVSLLLKAITPTMIQEETVVVLAVVS